MKLSAPLSTSQFGIYVECASHGGEAFYNLPYIYVLDRSLDGERLLAAIETAFKAHPTLFTRIELNDNGDPIQTLDMDNEPWSLAIEDIEDIEQEKPKLVTPYDINGGRLFHVKLMRNKEHYYLFWITITSSWTARRCRSCCKTSTRPIAVSPLPPRS